MPIVTAVRRLTAPELPMKRSRGGRFGGIFIPRWCPQGMGTCEGSATQALDPTSCGSFDFARRLASLRMTLHAVRGFETDYLLPLLTVGAIEARCHRRARA